MMLCVVAFLAAQTPEASKPTLAVVPVQVRADGVPAMEASNLLTRALTDQLSTLGRWRVLSPDDVSALLEHEGALLGMGCEDGSCIPEIANALGTRVVATGTLSRVGSNLFWTVSLLDTVDGTVHGRAAVQAGSLQALLSQSRELVLGLLGRGDEGALTGEAAQRRLGFYRAEDLKQFTAYRSAHAGLSTSEALTLFIMEHNLESPGLAVGEAIVFAGATALLIGAMVGFFGASAASSVQANAAVVVALLAAGACMVCSLVVGVFGLGLVVLDALDLGRVRVSRKGCCRQDSDLHDAANRSAVHRTAALSIALNGPVSILSVLLLAGGVSAYSSVLELAHIPLAARATGPAGEAAFWGLAGSFLCFSWIPVVVGCPVALVLLLKPDRALLEDLPP